MGLVDFMAGIRKLGPRWALVTDGIEGAYLAAPEGIFWRPSIPVTAQGTAGAGI